MSEQRDPIQSRGQVPFAAILILAIGIVLLLNTTDLVGWGIWWHIILRFWPVILIAVGFHIILAPRFPLISALVVAVIFTVGIGAAYLSNQTVESYSYQLGYESAHSSNLANIHTLDMNIDFGAGSLDVGSDMSGFGSDLYYVRSYGIGVAADETRNEGVSEVALSLDAPDALLNDYDDGWNVDIDLFGLFRSLGDIDWEVGISPDVIVKLDIDAGAADIDLDLRDVNLEVLDIDIGAADLDIVLPIHVGHTDVRIDAGAADIDISIPDDVAALIESDSALTSLDVDTSRFPGSDGTYQSPDYATAQNRVYINIDAGVSDISID